MKGGVRGSGSGSSGNLFTTSTSTGSGNGGEGSGNGGANANASAGSGLGGSGLKIPEGGACPSSCATLGANCGAVTDTLCGGIVMCGTCPSGQTCGGAGVHNVCGAGENPDACAPTTCQAQAISCGVAGDGCGGMLQCGTCTAPQTCGGDPTKASQCGCTGTCAMVPTCTGGTTTTLTGTVYDPAALHPLYNALVYIPNDPSDPGLQPFQPGITCDQCGATAAGNPLVSVQTAPDGTFTLSGVPVGASIPVVIQLGRWRRQFTINVANACAANSAGMLTMPSTHAEGDIPYVGILSGSLDPVECVLRKMGVADSEFTDPGGGGHINFFLADDPNAPYPPNQGHGASIDSATPNQAALFASNGGVPVLNNYDLVILECEGYPEVESQAYLDAIRTYAESGGRVFTSDYAYAWLYQNGNFAQAADWVVNQGYYTASPAIIDLTSNPKGMAFDQWLENVGVSAVGSDQIGTITPAFHNSNGVVAPTQQWLYYNSTTPIHFTFNTPVGAPSANQCGRVVFSDWHAESAITKGQTFPAECPSGPMTPQETIVEFMLFDLTSCVTPYTPLCTPKTCAGLNIQCGPAGDGCGGLLQCGSCPTGQFCGGSAPGMCGASSSCVPATCTSQGLQCGPAGDGCGNEINCGNCPTGEVCGLNGPGMCGKTQ